MKRFTPSEPFRPLPGAAGPHAQTILAQFLRPLRGPPVHRRRLETPDGDFFDVDQLEAPAAAPHLVVLHGLEGSSRSGYVVAMLRIAHQRGWGALAINFRSCSGEPNRIARSYCSGETADPLFAIDWLRAHGVTGPLLGVGFSLGGNVLLKLLGDTGERAPLSAAVAVSTPYDLHACARLIDRASGLTRLYKELFVRGLKSKAIGKARRHPEQLALDRILAADGIQAFDDVVTAPLYGFRDAADYYARCSSAFVLNQIRRPTLLISSVDDPIAPLNGEQQAASNPSVHWLVTERGGHVGFIAPSRHGLRFWAEATAAEFLAWSLADQTLTGESGLHATPESGR